MASQELLDRVEKAIETVESVSSAEVVVSFHSSAGEYRDIDLLWGILFGATTLAFQVWSSLHFHPDWLLANVMVMGLLGYLASRFLSGVRRLLVPAARMDRAVVSAARAQFLELGVDQTREHTGLLLFVCRFERRLYLVPDSGLRQALSPVFWTELNEKQGRFSSEKALLDGITELLEKITGPLQRQCPCREDDIDELPNKPVQAS